jgi:hypothetical protein
MIRPSWMDLSSWSAAVDSVRKQRLFRQVRGHTLASRQHLATLFELGRRIDQLHIPGSIVECGVYRGGSAAVLACATDAARDLYLFDSFAGLPPPGEHDGATAARKYRQGWCAASPEDVDTVFATLDIPRARRHVVKGWFAETLAATPVPQIALLHIDADWYDSVKLCLELLYPRVSPGGFVVLDDYGRWEGCTKAADEFLRSHDLGTPLDPRSSSGHFFQKPGRQANP